MIDTTKEAVERLNGVLQTVHDCFTPGAIEREVFRITQEKLTALLAERDALHQALIGTLSAMEAVAEGRGDMDDRSAANLWNAAVDQAQAALATMEVQS